MNPENQHHFETPKVTELRRFGHLVAMQSLPDCSFYKKESQEPPEENDNVIELIVPDPDPPPIVA